MVLNLMQLKMITKWHSGRLTTALRKIVVSTYVHTYISSLESMHAETDGQMDSFMYMYNRGEEIRKAIYNGIMRTIVMCSS